MGNQETTGDPTPALPPDGQVPGVLPARPPGWPELGDRRGVPALPVAADPAEGRDAAMPTPTYEDALAAAVQVMQEIARRDQFIADANARLAHRPTLLQHLVNHPILWLALGRDGIDRPGSAWTNLVGQQVVTVTRTSRWMVLLVASLMLFLGLGLGVALATWLPLSRLMHDLISTRS